MLRFKTQDLDLKGTDNWEAVFDIVKGNEAGYFSVRTDPLTNEGVLMLDKVLQHLLPLQILPVALLVVFTKNVGLFSVMCL